MRHLEHEVLLEDVIARYFTDVDLVVVEGYKELALPKIEVARSGQQLLCSPDELIAVVSDDGRDVQVPTFRPGDIGALATLVETSVLSPG